MKKSFKVIFIAMFVLMLPQHASCCDWFWKCVTRIKFCQIFNVGLCCPILIPCCSSIFVPLMNETEIEPLLRQSSTMMFKTITIEIFSILGILLQWKRLKDKNKIFLNVW